MSRLQEARDLLAATEGHTPAPFWDYGTPGIESNGKPMLLGRTLQEFVDGRLAYSAPALRDLLAAMVAEVEARRSYVYTVLSENSCGWEVREAIDRCDNCKEFMEHLRALVDEDGADEDEAAQ